MPFGLRGFENEIVFEGVGPGFVFVDPAMEETEPAFFRFAEEDEGEPATTVAGGVVSGDPFPFGRFWATAAAIAFFGRGFGVVAIFLAIGRIDTDGWFEGRRWIGECVIGFVEIRRSGLIVAGRRARGARKSAVHAPYKVHLKVQ